MAMKWSVAVKNAMAQTIIDAIDSGGAAGKIVLGNAGFLGGYTVDSNLGTTIAELPLSFPCGTVSNGVLTFSAITSDTYANNAGTISKARFYTSTGTPILDVDVSTTTGNGVLKLTRTTVVQGATIAINTFTIAL